MREMEYPDGDGGADGCCDIVAQSIISDTFCSSCRVEHIDGYSGPCHSGCPKGYAVEGAEDGKEGDGCSDEIACRNSCEKEVEDEENDLTRKCIDEVSADGAYEQGCQGIAREDYTDGFLVGSKSVAQIEGEKGHEQHERYVEHESGYPCLRIVAVPQLCFCSLTIHLLPLNFDHELLETNESFITKTSKTDFVDVGACALDVVSACFCL